MTERIVTTPDGLRLWSESFGDAADPPVLLIMGANASAFGWPDEFVELLAAHGLHVLRYDHRDTGRSSRGEPDRYSVDDLATDALAVLDGHGIAAAHVVGFSMGGTLGQLLALEHRDRVRSLTAVATAGLDVDFVANLRRASSGETPPDGLPTPSPEIVAEMAHRAEPAPDRESALERRIAEWRVLSGRSPSFDPGEFRRWENRAFDHAGSFQQPGGHTAARPPRVRDGAELAGITTPVLVVQGPLDPINPPPHGRHLAELIPGAQYLEIPGMGHALPGEVHSPLADALAEHIGRS